METAVLCFVLVQQVPISRPEVQVWEQRLNNDDFWEREKAEQQLRREDSFELSYALVKSRYPEVRLRAKQHYQSCKEKVLASLAPYPMLDSFWYDPKQRCYLANTSLAKRLYPYINNRRPWYEHEKHPDYNQQDIWWYYRAASRGWASDMLDAGVPVWFLKVVFQELHRRDKVFLDQCRHNAYYGQ